jgi:hypothetical protein
MEILKFVVEYKKRILLKRSTMKIQPDTIVLSSSSRTFLSVEAIISNHATRIMVVRSEGIQLAIDLAGLLEQKGQVQAW